ncbi:hypothetical protein GCK32_009965 [Trichostrongylus colubriformis]|uniref:Uncharacterized protein n=1 Tax=Trichostrongylus colubriformis TaxID=6319 RepID=A0AAN8IWZ3_TRICO
MSDGIQFTADIKGRSGCQFPLSLGTATCNQSTYGVLSVALADGTGSAVPFLCASEALPSLGNRMARLYRLTVSSNDKLKCSSQLTDSSAVEHLPLERTFVIVARNVKDDNINTSSTVDNVFIHPNNIFDHLVPYMMQNPGYYTTFLANIFSAENPSAVGAYFDI